MLSICRAVSSALRYSELEGRSHGICMFFSRTKIHLKDSGVFHICRYYYTHNSGLQAQNVIFTQSDLRGEPKVFLDPNKFSSDGTVALDSFTFSEDGRLVAYSTGRSVACSTLRNVAMCCSVYCWCMHECESLRVCTFSRPVIRIILSAECQIARNSWWAQNKVELLRFTVVRNIIIRAFSGILTAHSCPQDVYRCRVKTLCI